MPTPLRLLRPVGDRAVLVELGSLAEVLSLQAQLQEHPLPGQVDVVAAASTVLVTGTSAAAARGFAALLRRLDVSRAVPTDDTLVLIDTVYDGDDLDEVAALTGLTRDGVVAAHGGQVWTAAFGGFAPGFAYLVGENAALVVPRRSTPRHRVPAGSVALADAYSAVYPRQSPGGWQLIGRTAAVLWDLERAQPALVRPGNRVQFRAVRAAALAGADAARPVAARPGGSADSDASATRTSAGAATAVGAAGAAAGAAAPSGGAGSPDSRPTAGLVVHAAGLQTTVQDLGRPGYAGLGVAGSGALDRGALRRANRLVGNAATAAGLENALGGLVLGAVSDQVLAVSGASVSLTVTAPEGSVREVSRDAPFALLAGETVELGAPRSAPEDDAPQRDGHGVSHGGVRSYVAVRGGFDAPVRLGSRSTDTMSGIGPAPLQAGTGLSVLPAPPGSVVGAPESSPDLPGDVTVLRFVPGPRADWFSDDTLADFARREWTVTAQSNRIGLRLAGEALVRQRSGELPSEGTATGAIQLPASGLPVLFLADHPVTGGYPVLGVVLSADLDRAAQLATGARIRFTPVPGAAPVLPRES